ncbi:MAG: YncE family protein [Colwellia sp.]|nr:YncE family protein [Colwellia sp.]
MAKLNIIGPGYVGRSKNVNASRCVNFYPEVSAQDSKAVVSLVGTPGTEYFSDAVEGVIRGMHTFNDRIYFVAGNKLYSMDISKTRSSQLGTDLNTDIGRIQFADNGLDPGGNQLVFTDGTKIYCYNVVSTVFTIINITASTIAYIGGYFVADSTGGKFRVSDLLDGSTWGGSNVGTAEADPDSLVSVFNNHGELWLFGEYTTEVWYQLATGSPPFARASGGVIDFGCAAKYSIAKGNNTVYWLGNKRNGNQGQFVGVCMAVGYNAQVISPPSINYIIDNYATIDDAFAYFYTEEGHEFYVLTFPSANATWCYDTTTGFWHERSTYKDNPYKVGRHISNNYCHFRNRHFIGDYSSSNILEMKSSVYKDILDPIVSFRITDHIYDNQNLGNLIISKLQLDAETGVDFSNAISKYKYVTNSAAMGTRTYDSYMLNGFIYATDYTNGNLLKLEVENLSIVKTISVGSNPFSISYLFNYLWVSNNASGTVSKIDPTTDTVVATITVGSFPRKAIEGSGSVWVPNTGSDNLTKINPITDGTTTIALGASDSPIYLEYYDGYVWTLNLFSAGQMNKVNASTDAVVGFNYYTTHKFFSFYDGYLYLVSDASSSGKLSKIDPSDGSEADVVDITRDGNVLVIGDGLIVIDGYAWILNSQAYLLSKINLSTMTEDTEVSLDLGNGFSDPRAFIYALSYIWVVVNGENKVVRIDPDQNKIIDEYNVENDCRLVNNGDFEILIPGFVNFLKITKTKNEPQVTLSWSVDGGHTWSNEYAASLGKIGEYKKRLIWRRLGYSKDRVFRIAISSPVKKVLLDQYVEVTGENR